MSINRAHEICVANVKANLPFKIKSFWLFVNFKNKSSGFLNILTDETTTASTESEMCKLFSNYLESVSF